MPDHILRYDNIMVDFPIMNLEFEADKVGKDCCGARLRPDWRRLLFAGLDTHNGETVDVSGGVGDGMQGHTGRCEGLSRPSGHRGGLGWGTWRDRED